MSQIGEAFITVRPDVEFGNLFRDISRQVQLVGEVVETQTESMERSFRDLGDTISSTLRDNFARLVSQSESAGEGIQGAMQEAARQADAALNDIGGPLVFDQVARQAENTGERIERSFREAARQSERHLSALGVFSGSFWGSIAAQAVSALARITVEVGKQGLQLAGQLEIAKASFEVLLGSTSAANEFLGELRELAVQTPLEFSTLIESTRRVLAFSSAAGIARDEVLPFITVLGDLLTLLGQPQAAMNRVILAFGQIAGRGKVVTQELRQISEALPGFNPFQALAKGMGVTTAEITKLIEDGLVPASEGIPILIQAMREFPGAAGAMARFTDTLTGQFQRFTDQIKVSLADAFQPLIPTIKELLGELSPLLDAGIQPLVGGLNDFVGSAIPALLEGLRVLGPAFGTFFSSLLSGVGELGSHFEPIIRGIEAIFIELGETLETIGAALGPSIGVIGEVFETVLEEIGPPLRRAIEALGPIILQIVVFFGDVLEQAAPIVSALLDVITTFLDALQPALEGLQGPLDTFLSAFSDALVQAIESIPPETIEELAVSFGELAVALAELLVALTPLLVPLLQLAAIILTISIEQLSQGFSILADVVSVITPVIEFLATVIGTVITAVIDFFNGLSPLIGTIVKFLAVMGPAGLLIGAIAAAIGLVVAAFVLLHTQVIIPLIQTIVGGLIAAFVFLWQNVLVPIGTFIATVFVTAWNLLISLFTGVIIPTITALIDALTWLWQNVLAPIANFILTVLNVAFQAFIVIIFGPMLTAIGLLVFALILLWQHVLQPIWSFISANFIPVFLFLAGIFVGIVVTAIQGVITIALFLWHNVFQPIWGFIQGTLIPIFMFLAGALVGAVQNAFRQVINVATFLWHSVAEPLAAFFRGAWNAAVQVARGALSLFQAVISTTTSVLTNIWHNAIEPVANFLRGAWNDAWNAARGPVSLLRAAIDGTIGVIQTLIGVAQDAVDWIGNLAGAINDIGPDLSPGFDIPVVPFFQQGGFINAPTRGAPAVLHGRELVLPLDDARRSLDLLGRSGLFETPMPLGALGTRGDAVPVAGGTTIFNFEQHFGPGTTAADAREIADTTASALEVILERRRLSAVARMR